MISGDIHDQWSVFEEAAIADSKQYIGTQIACCRCGKTVVVDMVLALYISLTGPVDGYACAECAELEWEVREAESIRRAEAAWDDHGLVIG